MSGKPAIVFTGGGTGGHVFPLLAVARAVAEQAEVECVFVGTDRGLEARVVPEAGFRLELLPVRPVRGRGWRGAALGLRSVAAAVPRCRSLLREASVRAVFSLGGYAAAPMTIAARSGGIPLAMMEPNSVPGLANRLLARSAARVFLAFEQAGRYFPASATRLFGVAIRPGFEPVPCAALEGRVPRILVLGGSQGAQLLNERVPRAISKVSRKVTVHHQAGRGHGEAVSRLYGELLVESVEVSEFIEDMPGELSRADLVISRAGASAVAEICAVGRPSILVPLARSAGDHQRHNALALEQAGAAVCLSPGEDTTGRMAAVLEELAADSACLQRMARAAQQWGRPEAAHRVASELLELAGIAPRRPPPAPTSSVSDSAEEAR